MGPLAEKRGVLISKPQGDGLDQRGERNNFKRKGSLGVMIWPAGKKKGKAS